MRAVVTRVKSARVLVSGEIVGEISRGLLVLLGVGDGDTSTDAVGLATKIRHLRIFPDGHRPMNRSVVDAGGDLLAVSQFTLLADTSRGRRPSFIHAAEPEVARCLFDEFVCALRSTGLVVETGRFGATMEVESVNDGPVTILLDTGPEEYP